MIYSSFDIETVEYLRGFWQWRRGFSIRWDDAMACGQFFSNYTDPKRKSCPEMQLCITPLCMTCPHLPSFPFLSPPSENPPVLSLPAELIRVSFKALREGNSIKIISHMDAKRSCAWSHWESGGHERSCWFHSYQVSFCGHADENQVISDAHLLSFRPLLGCWVDRPPAGLSCTDRAEKQYLINSNCLWSNKEPLWTGVTAHLLNDLVDRRRTTACLSGSVMSSNRSGTGENDEFNTAVWSPILCDHGGRYPPCYWRSGEGGWHDHREGSGVHPLDRPDRKDTRVRMIRFSCRITGHSIRVSRLDEKKLS